MTVKEIIHKWQDEQDRLITKMNFCKEHNLPHEWEFLHERYYAIEDVLMDIRFYLDKED